MASVQGDIEQSAFHRAQRMISGNVSDASLVHLDSSIAPPLLRRNLKLIRGFNPSPELSLEDIDALTDAELRALVAYYRQTVLSDAEQANQIPSILQLMLTRSPYHHDVTHESALPQIDGRFSSELQSNGVEISSVHGVILEPGQVFTSTRYYSEDKQHYATIVARDGCFRASHSNLTQEQRADLALELAFQFLLDLRKGEEQEVLVSGSPHMAHSMRAAFLYLKHQMGDVFETNYPRFKITMPEGVEVDETLADEAYIKEHLGALPQVPSQTELFSQFLDLNTHQVRINGLELETHLRSIGFDEMLLSADLSEDHKTVVESYLLEMQRYFNGRKQSLNDLNSPHYLSMMENFTQKTATFRKVLDKSPAFHQQRDQLGAFLLSFIQEHEQRFEVSQQQMEQQRKWVQGCVDFRKNQFDQMVRHSFEWVKTKIEALNEHNAAYPAVIEKLAAHAQVCESILGRLSADKMTPDLARSLSAQLEPMLNDISAIHSDQFDESDLKTIAQIRTMPARIARYEERENQLKQKEKQKNQLSNVAQTMKERLAELKQGDKPDGDDAHLLTAEEQKKLQELMLKCSKEIKCDEELEGNGAGEELADFFNKMKNHPFKEDDYRQLCGKIDAFLPQLNEGQQNIKTLLESIQTLREHVHVARLEPLPSTPSDINEEHAANMQPSMHR